MLYNNQKSCLTFQPFNIARIFTFFTAFLLIGQFSLLVLRYSIGTENQVVRTLIKIFDFDQEKSLPTLYSGGLLSVCGLLFMILSFTRAPLKVRRASACLSAVFFFLSADEVLAIHEKLIGPTSRLIKTSGFFTNSWIIPYCIAGFVVLIITLPFFKKIDSRHRYLMATSAFVYVFGAVGLEMMEGQYLSLDISNIVLRKEQFPYQFMVTIEETLEMMGCIILIYTLLSLIRAYGGFSVQIPGQESEYNIRG
ncbi:MAG: hypothetical protein WBA10_12170 [Elainellaceae cyanobacterium]